MDRPVKLLLTLLALLSGLVVAPAQARPCLGAKAFVEQVQAGQAAVDPVPGVDSAGEIAWSSPARQRSDRAQRGDGLVAVATIRIGDQALE